MKKSESLRNLEAMEEQRKRMRYTSLPQHAIPKTKHTDTTANGLTKAVLAWLELNGHKAWRQSSEGRYRPGIQYTDVLGHRKQLPGKFIPGTNKGHSDVQSIINGLFVAWEIKMRDKQSEAQKRFQEEVEASGGKYYIVRSFDEFMRIYKQTIQ